MMKKLSLMILFIGCMLFMPSCSSIKFSTEELMRPPKLTPEQAQIYAALEMAAGQSNISLKYPKSGNYRSAFIFFDIDNDTTQEVLVLFSTEDSPFTRILLLKNTDELWEPIFNVPGLELDVEFVSFNKLSSDEYYNVIIGWSNATRQDQDLTIYQYEERTLSLIHQNFYSEIYVNDLNEDFLDDIILIQRPSQGNTVELLLIGKQDDRVAVLSQLQLLTNSMDFLNITHSKLPDHTGQALFLDEKFSDNSIATQVISIEQNVLTPLLTIADTSALFSQTKRYAKVYCEDINNDGYIEIPTETLLPGYETEWEMDKIYLTNYCKLAEYRLTPVLSAVVNSSAGYMVEFPKIWIDNKVTVVKQPENGEWRFMKYKNHLNDFSQEIARIRVRSKKDYQDKFLQQYELFATKENLEYYGYVSAGEVSPLSITIEQLKKMFSLIE